jgi:hypothetical protein
MCTKSVCLSIIQFGFDGCVPTPLLPPSTPTRNPSRLRGLSASAFMFLALACLSLCTGCVHRVGVITSDKSIAAILKNEKVGIVSVNSTHLNSTLSHDVAVGMVPILAITTSISEMANPRDDYVTILNRNSVAAIDAELCKTSAFQYAPVLNPEIHFNKPSAIDNQAAIAQAISSKGLRWGLGLEIDYGVIAGFNKQMASKITWCLYDASGVKRIVIATVVSTGTKAGFFPNTTDAKYHDAYVAIAHKSAADFLSFLTGESPHYQQELSVFKMKEFRSGSSRIFTPKNSVLLSGGR